MPADRSPAAGRSQPVRSRRARHHEFQSRVEGRPREPIPIRGCPLSVESLHLARADAAFADLVATYPTAARSQAW
jgi:hypothetical protein